MARVAARWQQMYKMLISDMSHPDSPGTRRSLLSSTKSQIILSLERVWLASPETNPKRRRENHNALNVSHHSSLHVSSVGAGADGVTFTDASSDPPPLWPRFRPGMWKPKDEVEVLGPGACASLLESPNLDRKPFFLGFTSSFNPTSSKASSSMISDLVRLLE